MFCSGIARSAYQFATKLASLDFNLCMPHLSKMTQFKLGREDMREI